MHFLSEALWNKDHRHVVLQQVAVSSILLIGDFQLTLYGITINFSLS
jgi:hypothetical protein